MKAWQFFDLYELFRNMLFGILIHKSLTGYLNKIVGSKVSEKNSPYIFEDVGIFLKQLCLKCISKDKKGPNFHVR